MVLVLGVGGAIFPTHLTPRSPPVPCQRQHADSSATLNARASPAVMNGRCTHQLWQDTAAERGVRQARKSLSQLPEPPGMSTISWIIVLLSKGLIHTTISSFPYTYSDFRSSNTEKATKSLHTEVYPLPTDINRHGNALASVYVDEPEIVTGTRKSRNNGVNVS